MHGVTVLQHNIVCYVNEIIYGTYSAGAKPFPHPARGHTYLDVLYHACDIAGAKLFVMDSHFQHGIDIPVYALVGGFLDGVWTVKCGVGFPRKTDNGHTVGAVGGYLELHGGIVKAYSLADILTQLKGHAVLFLLHDENSVGDSVGKIVSSQSKLAQRAEHTV